MKRIAELESLRGLMAWWVVICHLLGLSGFGKSPNPVLRLLILDGESAVRVFIILSGFVIFYLLDSTKMSYPTFLLRRWLRLWPVFAVCFGLAVLLAPWERWNLIHGPFIVNSINLCPNRVNRIDGWTQNIWAHAALCLSFCQGFFPDDILPRVDRAFLVPGWSIGLEWQFYVVAPFLYRFIQASNHKSARIGWLLLAILIIFAPGEKWKFWNNAFLFAYAKYFAIGILSYFLWKEKAGRASLLTLGLLFAGGLVSRETPIIIWVCVLVIVLAGQGAGGVLKGGGAFLRWKPLQHLGKISYSTYLIHWPMITVSSHLCLIKNGGHSDKWSLLLFNCAVAIPLIYLVSLLLHRWVELPFQGMGKRIGDRDSVTVRGQS